jgi:hypothetical protein
MFIKTNYNMVLHPRQLEVLQSVLDEFTTGEGILAYTKLATSLKAAQKNILKKKGLQLLQNLSTLQNPH